MRDFSPLTCANTRALDILVDSPRDLPSLTCAVSRAVQVLAEGLRNDHYRIG